MDLFACFICYFYLLGKKQRDPVRIGFMVKKVNIGLIKALFMERVTNHKM